MLMPEGIGQIGGAVSAFLWMLQCCASVCIFVGLTVQCRYRSLRAVQKPSTISKKSER